MNSPPPYSSADSKRSNQQQSTVVQVVQPPMIVEEPPEDWMIISIFNCLCCCWLLGIHAIVLSANSRSAAKIGNMEAARSNAKGALALNISGIIIGLSVITTVFVINFA